MPASSSRREPPRRTSPRPAPAPGPRVRSPLGRSFPAATPERPMVAPFAAAFGGLVAAEDGYLAWLLWGTRAWYVVAAVLLGLAAVAGAVLTLLGRGRGWLVLTLASVVPLVTLLALVLLLGALGTGHDTALALLLLVGPVGCLALALQRPVREWTTPAPRAGPAGERRSAVRAR